MINKMTFKKNGLKYHTQGQVYNHGIPSKTPDGCTIRYRLDMCPGAENIALIRTISDGGLNEEIYVNKELLLLNSELWNMEKVEEKTLSDMISTHIDKSFIPLWEVQEFIRKIKLDVKERFDKKGQEEICEIMDRYLGYFFT